jgi:hypothetical protein
VADAAPVSPDAMARRIRWQADACRALGSPLYSGLLQLVADDVLDNGPAGNVLAGHENDAGQSALALRLMGGVHRIVLDGRAPGLAAFYPSVGGSGSAAAAWPALRSVLSSHRGELRTLLDQPPQTNEVGRAACLIGGLLHIASRWPGPLRLFEIGASAGLNLRADQFRVALPGGRGVGPIDSPVVLDDAWDGALPPIDASLDVIERAGCDTAPLDPTTDEGRLRLMSYVWPDQQARLERLRGALDVAARVPAEVRQERATDFVRRLDLTVDTTTVVWHSVMWQYLSRDEQDDVSARLDELGAGADRRSRLAHLSLEPHRSVTTARHDMLVTLRVWPAGEERVLGTAAPHGLPTTWA